MHPITALLDWTVNTNQVGLFVAQQQGFFHQKGLTVSIPPVSDASTMQWVGNNKVESSMGYQEFLTFARANSEPPVPIVAVRKGFIPDS